MKKTLRFTAADTWFFRESRPHGSVGFSELDSVFPPPVRTLAGALRTAIGDAHGVNWHEFNQSHAVCKQIGFGDDYGPLCFQGPWLSWQGQRLYPWPLNLMHKEDPPDIHSLERLQIGAAVKSSLGFVHTPQLPKDCQGFKPMEQVWLTESGFAKVLAGETPEMKDCIELGQMLVREPRLGIAIDTRWRTVHRSLLYQTRHLRPKPGFAVEVDVEGLDAAVILPPVLRLGGEGRMAALEVHDAVAALAAAPNVPQQGIILYLLTPALFVKGWLPDGFAEGALNGGVKCWEGTLHGVALTIHAAVIGKAVREGGWNQAERKPRNVASLVPAGSAWYCTVKGDVQEAAKTLHGKQVGGEQELGRGCLAVGIWPETENGSSD